MLNRGHKLRIMSFTFVCIFFFITILTIKSNLNYPKTDFDSFEKNYLNIIETYANPTQNKIVISKNDGLYEKNGCYMIDEKSFTHMTGVTITTSEDKTDFRFENSRIQIQSNTILKQNGDVELLPQEVDYFNGKCAFPVQTVAEALGYTVNISDNEEEQSITLTREFSTKRLIVKYNGSIDSHGAVAAAEGYNGLHIFQYADESSTAKAYTHFKSLSYIEYVESDEVVTVEETTTESSSISYSSTYRSWGAEAMGVGNYTNHINSTVSTLPEIIIAVIDTGIDTDHEWFTNRIAAGGKNFSLSKNDNKQYEYEDDQGHGTHVSGIITDLTMENVKILPIKVLNSSGIGYASSIAVGIQYVTSLKKSGRNIRALNMSLGGTATTESNQLYSSSLSEAYDNGILPVVAAGNENTDVLYVSPANVSCAITVAALANANHVYYRPYYSNYGAYVDVCAPGSAILSAKMGGGTVSLSGTSMASPHVVAAAALVFTEHSEYTLSQVEHLLTSTAVDLGDTGKDKFYGYGMVNLRYIYANLLSDVTFSKNEFECTQAFNLTISHTRADAIIYYTTDGSIPTPENGIRYTSPIEIKRSVRIKAAAYVFDGSNITAYSNPKEITYRFGSQDLENCFIVDDTTGGLVYYQGILENLTVPQVIDGTTITTICSGAFTATNVVNVILPNTVTEIQNSAFRECKNLETVKALSVESIGNYAFQSCSKLKYLTDDYFPELTKIGAYAFYQCANLYDISLSKVEFVDAFAFYMKNTTPQYLTSIDLPSVKTISDSAFYCAKYVTSVNLPKVEVVAKYAFSTNDIRNLYLPKAVYLGNFSFQGNNRMTQADLPEAVYLGVEALAADTTGGTLSTVNIPKAKILGMYVIQSTAVKHIDLPSAETLLPLAFYNHPNLESFTAPNLKYVGSDAFGFCRKLTEANLPSVISLGNAFCNCSKLQKITLSPCLEKMTYYSTSDRGSITALKDVPETCIIYYYQGTAFEGFYKTTGIKNPIINLSNDEAFTYMIVNGEVYITGINGEAPEELIIPSYINKMPVTKICEGAFEGCSASIKLNVLYLKEIEADAFKDCSNLTEVYLTRINQIGKSAFEGCSALENVTIDGILKIGAYAFNGCTNLTTITLPACIESIGQKALGFASEEVITDFVIYGDVDTLAQAYALENDIEFKTIFENIDGFYYDTYINEETGNEEIEIILVDTYTTGNIIIPESYNGKIVSKIGEEAFRGCLVSGVMLPDTIKEIDAYAFRDCDFLESINLESITSIGKNAFYGCSSLKHVNMPLVEELPNGVFSSCGSLKIADLSGATIIGQDVFSQCYELEKVICPNLVTLDAAFNMATSLKSVDTKNVVTIIGKAFIYCKSIEELYFPNLETVTNGGVFAYCPSLKKVVIGEKLKSYVVDNTLDLADFTYYNVPVYGYSGSLAEEWASQCWNYNNTKRWEFTAIDDIDTLAITKDLANEVEAEYKSLLSLSVEAEGIGLTYQWYQTEGDISLGIPIQGATGSQYIVDTAVLENYHYFVKVTDWKGNTVDSQICEVTITNANSKYISVTLGEHVSSPQNGIHPVNEGEDYQITLTIGDGYHITSIVVDEVVLSEEELESVLINGYEFTNVLADHTIVINSAPNEDTVYKVYHYKESLEITSYEIDGKYYELEEETLTGTTAALTAAVAHTYEGFTAEDFEQKNINGSGDTIVSILYNRNSYTVTLVTCEGVTVEGAGTYLYGEMVVIKSKVDTGYVWVEWQSSNPDALPSEDAMEYTFHMPSLNVEFIAIVNILQPDQVNIQVKAKDHIISAQTGNHQIAKGETFKVTFTTEVGYHISSIVVDEVVISAEELETALILGYEFTNISENHTIELISAPNTDTEYKVYHYKQSLETTPYQMDGKYYELEEETLTGTTAALTAAVARTYAGFTVDAFEQKNINGNGNTIVSILYNRNRYSVTLVSSEGVTIEGSGSYLYGEAVVVKAKVTKGYEWVRWESSDPDVCPSNDSIEYTFSMPSANIELKPIVKKETQAELPDKVNISVILDSHVFSPQLGNNQVPQGENFKITFTAGEGYHISSIVIDQVVLTAEEIKTILLTGYSFNNLSSNHSIVVYSAPNEDTVYMVYHYIETFKATSHKINGKFYDIETERCTGRTGAFTAAIERTYEGFTAEDFKQERINEYGNTIVRIIYNRNRYSVTLVKCAGVTIEGNGNYLYGESVVVRAIVAEGYEWVRWESSNTTLCPNGDSMEYSFSMPSANIELKPIVKKKTQAELPEPSPGKTPEKQGMRVDIIVWISISIGLLIILLIIIIIIIVKKKMDNKRKQKHKV